MDSSARNGMKLSLVEAGILGSDAAKIVMKIIYGARVARPDLLRAVCGHVSRRALVEGNSWVRMDHIMQPLEGNIMAPLNVSHGW